MKDLIIIGAGGMGRETAWLVEDINAKNNEWNLLGFIDDEKKKQGKDFNGYKVLGDFSYLYSKRDIYYVCAIANARLRKKIIEEKCKKLPIIPATLIHPSVIISKYNKIGEGTIICAGTIITINTSIGIHNIINMDCTIAHDVVMEDYVTVYPSVNVSGNCSIGNCVELGVGTQIIQGKNIGENSIIGAGAVVVKDIEKNITVVGVPAKNINKM